MSEKKVVLNAHKSEQIQEKDAYGIHTVWYTAKAYIYEREGSPQHIIATLKRNAVIIKSFTCPVQCEAAQIFLKEWGFEYN